jgi:hypothetical protein
VFTVEEYQKLKMENEKLKAEAHELRSSMLKFLNEEQLETALRGHKLFEKWQHASVIKALKFWFALGVHGFEFLRDSGYPLPSYSTILRRV